MLFDCFPITSIPTLRDIAICEASCLTSERCTVFSVFVPIPQPLMLNFLCARCAIFAFVRTFGCFATAAEWIMILDAGHMLLCINWSMLLGTCCLFLQIFFWLPYWLVHLLLHCLVIWILMPSVQHCHHWVLLKIHTKFFSVFDLCHGLFQCLGLSGFVLRWCQHFAHTQ